MLTNAALSAGSHKPVHNSINMQTIRRRVTALQLAAAVSAVGADRTDKPRTSANEMTGRPSDGHSMFDRFLHSGRELRARKLSTIASASACTLMVPDSPPLVHDHENWRPASSRPSRCQRRTSMARRYHDHRKGPRDRRAAEITHNDCHIDCHIPEPCRCQNWRAIARREVPGLVSAQSVLPLVIA